MPDSPTIVSQQATTAAPRGPAGRAPLSLDMVADRLKKVAALQEAAHRSLDEFALTTAELTTAECTAVFTRGSDQWRPTAQINVTCSPADEPQLAALQQACDETEGRRPRVIRVDDHQVALAVPVAATGGSPAEVLAAVLRLGDRGVEPFVVTLQMVAAYITLWRANLQQRKLDEEANSAAATVDLVSHAAGADSVQAACLMIATQAAEFLGCQQVAIALCHSPGGGQMRLAALSGRPQFDRRGKRTREFDAALEESGVRGEPAVWPPATTDQWSDPTQRVATLAHQQLAQSSGAQVLSAPLVNSDGEVIGAWLALTEQPKQAAWQSRFIAAAAASLAATLQVVKRAEGSRMQRAARWLLANRGRRALIAASVVLALGAAMLIPVPHKISADCVLQPQTRRFAVAPHDGVLLSALAQPGDEVAAGQLLAKMDDRELQWELTGLLAERDRAAKKHDAALASQDIPAAQLADLERQRLQLEIDLLQHRLNNLEIRSEQAGIVLSGEDDSVTGAPVKTGQPLYEIAPLDTLRLEVAVPEADLRFVTPDQQVKIALEGYADQTLTGTIASIRPQAEIRGGQNTFVAEVQVLNEEGNLRPGAAGQAKIVALHRPLGWVLFHRLWEKVSLWWL